MKKIIFYLSILIIVIMTNSNSYSDDLNDCYGDSMGCSSWSTLTSRSENFTFAETGDCQISVIFNFRYCLTNPNIYEFSIAALYLIDAPPGDCDDAEDYLFPNGTPDWDRIQLIFDMSYVNFAKIILEEKTNYQTTYDCLTGTKLRFFRYSPGTCNTKCVWEKDLGNGLYDYAITEASCYDGLFCCGKLYYLCWNDVTEEIEIQEGSIGEYEGNCNFTPIQNNNGRCTNPPDGYSEEDLYNSSYCKSICNP